jgi:trimethylamine--corrinoid protein Co-methyltransferase
VIRETGPGGEFLSGEHTFQNFRNEFYEPLLEERSNFPTWIQQGGLTMERKANMKWKEILANYQEPTLSKGVDRALKRYIEKI